MVSQGGGAVVAVCCALLLVTGPAAAVGAAPSTPHSLQVPSHQPAQLDSPAPAQVDSGVDCFPDSGYNFTIGTFGPQIEMVLHLSLLTNLGAPGTLGVELAGTADGREPLIELRTGAVFHGVTDVEAFLNDPFGVFSIAFEYRFQLPLAGIDYETTDAPISGPVSESRCA